MKLTVIALALGLVAASLVGATWPPTTPPSGDDIGLRAAAPPPNLYTAQVTGALAVGQDGKITVKLVPAEGYKWNVDYPAKLKLPAGQKVEFKKTDFARGDFKGGETAGILELDAKGKAAGDETVTATASFSICSKETCHLLRDRKIDLKLSVK